MPAGSSRSSPAQSAGNVTAALSSRLISAGECWRSGRVSAARRGRSSTGARRDGCASSRTAGSPRRRRPSRGSNGVTGPAGSSTRRTYSIASYTWMSSSTSRMTAERSRRPPGTSAPAGRWPFWRRRTSGCSARSTRGSGTIAATAGGPSRAWRHRGSGSRSSSISIQRACWHPPPTGCCCGRAIPRWGRSSSGTGFLCRARASSIRSSGTRWGGQYLRCGVGRRSGLPGSPAAESRARDGGALLEHAKLRPDDALGHELRAGERPEPAVDRRDHAACDPVSHNFGVLGGFSQTSLRERFITMSTEHWLGTDQLGRDLLTRLIYGAPISLYMGFGAVALGSVLATVIGVLSAYFGGRLDLLPQRASDAWMAFPPLLLLMTIMSL